MVAPIVNNDLWNEPACTIAITKASRHQPVTSLIAALVRAIDSSLFYRNQITIAAFNDLNGNGKYDNEPFINFDTITVSKNGVIVNQFLPGQNGFNSVSVDTGTYTISISYNKPYYTTAAPVQTITFKYYNSADTIYFPVIYTESDASIFLFDHYHR